VNHSRAKGGVYRRSRRPQMTASKVVKDLRKISARMRAKMRLAPPMMSIRVFRRCEFAFIIFFAEDWAMACVSVGNVKRQWRQ